MCYVSWKTKIFPYISFHFPYFSRPGNKKNQTKTNLVDFKKKLSQKCRQLILRVWVIAFIHTLTLAAKTEHTALNSDCPSRMKARLRVSCLLIVQDMNVTQQKEGMCHSLIQSFSQYSWLLLWLLK